MKGNKAMLFYSYEQYDEEMNSRLATPSDAIREYTYNYGMDNPDMEWIVSPYDTWERNPYYTGKPGPHSEEYDYEEDEENVNNIDTGANYVSVDFEDDIPF